MMTWIYFCRPEKTRFVTTTILIHFWTLGTVVISYLQDGAALQAFVFRVKAQIVGLMIIRDEEVNSMLCNSSSYFLSTNALLHLSVFMLQDIEFIQANFDIERFMYFSHHQREEHGRLCHFILNPICQHHGKHFFKEALRLAHKTCLYYPLYPTQHSHEVGKT